MEIDFREPRLTLRFLIHAAATADATEPLRAYLVEKCNARVYKEMIEKQILPYSKEDLKAIAEKREERLHHFEEEKEQDLENESHVSEVNKKICEFYAQMMELEDFNKVAKEIMLSDPSLSLKMDIYLCKIRIAIIQNDRAVLVESIGLATEVFDSTCDWDRKNRFKVYLGLYSLLKADFRTAATLFSEALASFDAPELLGFDQMILYLVFSALLGFSRNEIKEKILENSEARKREECMRLPECYHSSEYGSFFQSILAFIDLFADDVFIGPFKEHFCREMKIKGYSQLLCSYRSVCLDKMAEVFKVEEEHLEEDLRNFINDGRLPCVIDKVDGIVEIVDVKNIDQLKSAAIKGDAVLRNIKKMIN